MATQRERADTWGVISLLPTNTGDTNWLDAIDVDEYHQMDFDEVRRQGTAVVIARAGRGTRQDGRWIEHVRAADDAGLAVGSYWHLYPSHTTAHHQAALWTAAIAVAPSLFPAGHWLHVATADGLAAPTLRRYVDACLRRTDELLGRRVGVCTDTMWWRDEVRLLIDDRPLWECPLHGRAGVGDEHAVGVRTLPADRGGPGRHRVRADVLQATRPAPHGLHLVVRGPSESVQSWQRRWLRTPDVATLQRRLNELGAALVVDGVYGPATDAAVRVWHDLCRRDLVGHTPVPCRPAGTSTTDRTAHR